MTYEFVPKKFPSLTVYFNFTPGQMKTFYDPGFEEDIEFIMIECNGYEIDNALESHLIEYFGNAWGKEIIDGKHI